MVCGWAWPRPPFLTYHHSYSVPSCCLFLTVSYQSALWPGTSKLLFMPQMKDHLSFEDCKVSFGLNFILSPEVKDLDLHCCFSWLSGQLWKPQVYVMAPSSGPLKHLLPHRVLCWEASPYEHSKTLSDFCCAMEKEASNYFLSKWGLHSSWKEFSSPRLLLPRPIEN